MRTALKELYPLAQGGTAVGTGLNAKPQFAKLIAKRIAALTGMPFVTAPNKFEALASHDAIVFVHGALNVGGDRPVQDRQRHPAARIGTALGARRTDPAGERARLLDHARQGESDAERSPDHGLLPGVRQRDHRHGRGQPGPFRTQCLQAGDHYATLQSIRLLADAAVSFTDHCVVGIRANEPRIRELMKNSLMLVTALAPNIGYERAATIAKAAHANGTTLREEALRLGYVSAAEFDRLVRPEKMTRPG